MSLGLLDPDEADRKPPDALEGAGMRRRAIARLLDLGVLQVAVALGAAAGYLLSLLLGDWLGEGTGAAVERLANAASESWRGSLTDFLVGLAGLTVLHTACEGLHGATLGKMLCGITVVSEDGTPAGLGAALKRSLGFLVDQLALGLVGVHKILHSPLQQRLGDEWAGTRVVRRDRLPDASRRSALRFVAGAVAGLVASGAVGFVGVLAQVRHHARLAAQDRVEIVAVSGGRDLGGGREATVAIQVRYTLRSAPSGTLRVFVLRDSDAIPQPGWRAVTRGSGSVALEAAVQLSRGRPDQPDDAVFAGLFPERNEAQPSAVHGLDLRLVDCDRPGAKEGPGDVCVG